MFEYFLSLVQKDIYIRFFHRHLQWLHCTQTTVSPWTFLWTVVAVQGRWNPGEKCEVCCALQVDIKRCTLCQRYLQVEPKPHSHWLHFSASIKDVGHWDKMRATGVRCNQKRGSTGTEDLGPDFSEIEFREKSTSARQNNEALASLESGCVVHRWSSCAISTLWPGEVVEGWVTWTELNKVKPFERYLLPCPRNWILRKMFKGSKKRVVRVQKASLSEREKHKVKRFLDTIQKLNRTKMNACSRITQMPNAWWYSVWLSTTQAHWRTGSEANLFEHFLGWCVHITSQWSHQRSTIPKTTLCQLRTQWNCHPGDKTLAGKFCCLKAYIFSTSTLQLIFRRS